MILDASVRLLRCVFLCETAILAFCGLDHRHRTSVRDLVHQLEERTGVGSGVTEKVAACSMHIQLNALKPVSSQL